MKDMIDWLLGKDDPSVRYFTLRHLLDQSEDDRDVQTVRPAIMETAPIQRILAAQNPEGYWVKPGPGLVPRYQATSWQLIFLAELGADEDDQQVHRACEYFLAHSQRLDGALSPWKKATSSRPMHCFNGNLIRALIALGYAEDERVIRAADWLARVILCEDTNSSIGSTILAPDFNCAGNMRQPCAWGAVKSLRAMASLRPELRSERLKKALILAAEFLLSHDLAKAYYPYTFNISNLWFKFGFPLSYTSDVLEAFIALSEAGYGRDPRLTNAFELVLSKRDTDGRWLLEHSLNGKMWADIEVKDRPSKWVTLRALRALKLSGYGNTIH